MVFSFFKKCIFKNFSMKAGWNLRSLKVFQFFSYQKNAECFWINVMSCNKIQKNVLSQYMYSIFIHSFKKLGEPFFILDVLKHLYWINIWCVWIFNYFFLDQFWKKIVWFIEISQKFFQNISTNYGSPTVWMNVKKSSFSKNKPLLA